jgi:arabinan endo-1,5-alpha-L-arabinosidase
MKTLLNKNNWLSLLLFATVLLAACKKNPGSNPAPAPPSPPAPPGPVVFDINSITDTYGDLAPFANYQKWGSYNVHDPSIIKSGDYFYSFSTDVAYGTTVRPGLQVRKSKDLVEWTFDSWVFNSLPAQGVAFITQAGGTPFNGLWAPYIIKVGSEFRLYYSLSSPTPRLSVIGLATAAHPLGPWTEKGLVVTSKNESTLQTNAIDPTVVVTPSGEHWMYYGSAWDGIYILKLNPSTGLAQTSNDKGVRIAQRGFTGSTINGNIEGPEIIYNSSLNKYYLFIAYDWLETKYNVRVGRANSPEGPFLDFNGKDMNIAEDHIPMIIAPYKFNSHGGWQGVAHCSVFENDGQYYMAHQGRPGVDKFFMDMHVRKIFWTTDGWPVVSPERYAWEKDSLISQNDITGEWEQIILGYNVVPGFQNEQTSPDFQTAVSLTIAANGTLNGNSANTWTYIAPWLQMNWSNGFTDKVFVQKGRDWENKKNTIVFSGLNNKGTAVWGKKKS